MPPARSPRCGVGVCSIATLALSWALAPGAAPAAVGVGADRELSPRLAELAEPVVRTAPPAEQARRLSVPREGPGSLLRDGNRVLVEVRFERGAAAGADDLRRAGAEIHDVSARYQTVTAGVKPADLAAVGDVAGVGSVTEVLTPLAAASECAGSVTSEGDAQLRAAEARSSLGVDGSGAKVGILSDSFDADPGAATHASGDIASGDLPGPGNPCGHTQGVSVLQDYGGPEEAIDEGRGMAQIVHDLAPGASISFATAFTGELGFASNIRALASAGADVIVDDILYFAEPFFQDGPVAVAADEVAASGVAYFSSAGNDNLVDGEGRNVASWEAPEFRETECPEKLTEFYEGLANVEQCMDFDPGSGEDPTFELTVAEGATLVVDLQWAEPRNGVDADLDFFLLDEEGEPIAASTENNPGEVNEEEQGTQRPFELLGWENATGSPQDVQLAVNRCFGPECNKFADPNAMPRLKFVMLQNGSGVTGTEYPQSGEGDVVGPTLFGHAAATGANAVAAVPASNSAAPEPYSSRGPVTYYFGPVAGTEAAEELPGPDGRSKPDLAATDCNRTTFFVPTETPGLFRFCGTSAAAPHAAAVAALVRGASPGVSLAQIRDALAATARPVGAFGPDAVGAGLVDALGAVGRVIPPLQVSITARPRALSANRAPAFGFVANRAASFACSIDGSAPAPCASPFVSAPLSDGVHGFAVTATDAVGLSGSSELVAFTIDTRPPRAFFRKRPRKTIRTAHRRRRVAFRFGSNEKPVTFSCRVDRRPFRRCGARLVRRFGLGRHVVRVRARDAAGNVGRGAVHRFRLKRKRPQRKRGRGRRNRVHPRHTRGGAAA